MEEHLEVYNNMAKDEQPPTKFEEFAGRYGAAKQYQFGLEDVAGGKGSDAIPQLVQNVLLQNEALSEQQRGRLWEGLKTDLNNYYVVSPVLKEGYRKQREEFAKFGKENLEGILHSTPEDFMGQILMKNAPGKKNPTTERYQELGELHNKMLRMKSTLDAFKDTAKVGEPEKGQLVAGMKSEVLKYYKDQYKVKDGEDPKVAADKKAAFKFFEAVIQYKKDDGVGRFVIEAYQDILGDVSHKFAEKIQGNEIDYLKSFLKEDDLLKVYEGMLNETYKRKEK
ncbi:Uncharacterised protein [uncultured archaeon]|nr:Uncharacterised protein [uncultured archaeon]